MFNLANNLTLTRILAIPVLVLLLYFPSKSYCLAAAIAFLCASLTDLADGVVARRYNLVTTMGKFLDPLADKLLITSVLIMLVHLDWVPAWIAILIVGREMSVTGLRAVAADQGMIIAADRYGKMKTIFQIIALVPLILHYSWFGLNFNLLGHVVLYVALFLALFSGGNYFYHFYRFWRKQSSATQTTPTP